MGSLPSWATGSVKVAIQALTQRFEYLPNNVGREPFNTARVAANSISFGHLHVVYAPWGCIVGVDN